MVTRRKFLKVGGIMTMAGAMAPSFMARTMFASDVSLADAKKALVVIQLGGGNDGLNTVVPYADDNYYKLRPTIGLKKEDVLPLDDGLALNKNLKPFKDLYDNNQLAIIRGVGYPNPNYSHFRSMEIWQSAEPEKSIRSGWLGRYLENNASGAEIKRLGMTVGNPSLGGGAPLAFWTEKTVVLSYNGPQSFVFQTENNDKDDRTAQLAAAQRIYNIATQNDLAEYIRTTALDALSASDYLSKLSASYKPSVEYPKTPFADRLKNVAQVLTSDFGARIFYVPMDGSFDTHFNENATHDRLLGILSDGLSAFYKDLQAKGVADNVLTMTFSEFGRRTNENGSRGTDHGSAAPMFVIGGTKAVKGGMYGEQPSLSDLDNGNLKEKLDFRSVYATLMKNWLGATPAPIVGGEFPLLDFVRG